MQFEPLAQKQLRTNAFLSLVHVASQPEAEEKVTELETERIGTVRDETLVRGYAGRLF